MVGIGIEDATVGIDGGASSFGANALGDVDEIHLQSGFGFEVEALSLASGAGIRAAGNAGNNWIWGNGLNNVLVGGGGTDGMWGGLGNDTYYVDSADDVAGENANEGIDTVFAASSYTLSANVEALTLANGAGISATGNAGNNWIWGNGLNNVLVGGGGTDAMWGGLGDDTYYVDSADDVAGENANEGSDTVFATSSYTLSANVERLSLANGSGISATGNAGNNDISGNGLNNVLMGRGGADAMSGGLGADTFVFDLTALTPAQPGSGVVDHILDYNQGNGTFNSAEGDTFDFSALLSAGNGQPVGNLVQVLESSSGTGAILQIDQDGTANGAQWTTIALLDGVHAGDGVNVIFNASQPAATLDWHLV